LQERFGAYPISSKGVVTERLRRVSDQEILYQFRVDDPDLYSGVWSGEMTFRKSDKPIHEYACHEGNYALPGILRVLRQARTLSPDADGVATSGESFIPARTSSSAQAART
jgi:hypothetical protein